MGYKIAILQGTNQGFFPRFYKSLKSVVEADGCSEVKLFAPNSGKNKRCILPNLEFWGFRINWHIHSALFRITGKQDCWSHLDTFDLIRKLKKFNPDILHFHVINQCQINFPMLIRYVNKNHIPVVWTFHDCRAFTGGCPYFDEIKCEKWKNGCLNCPDKGGFYVKNFANTEWQWKFRKKWFTNISNLHIVTPSQWLADFVKQSFLNTKCVQVIYNGVDIESFASNANYDVKTNFNIPRCKKIVLGCAIDWSPRKGLAYFKEIALKLSSDYQVVLVGGISQSLKEQLNKLGVICTGRTKTFNEMKAWYQAASVFVNPTLADNFPTVNIEALASGTPVVTFNTGGSPEAIDENTGLVVEQGNVDALKNAIVEICEKGKNTYSFFCMNRANMFSCDRYKDYVELYQKVVVNET